MTTQVLYQSPKIKIQYENDTYSVVATEDLKVGERVLLEIVIWSPRMAYMIASILYDTDLSSELYPRNRSDPGEKMEFNMFQFDNNYVLGKLFSKFNHSCIPNCHMDAADYIDNTRVYGMWVHRKIKAGEELTIDYVNTNVVEFHNAMKTKHGFKCSCTDEFIHMNDKRAEIHKNIGATFSARDRDYTAALVDQFLQSKEGKQHTSHKAQVVKIEKKVKVC